MKRGLGLLLTVTSFFVSVIISAGPAFAHEPIFGLGAHTLYKGGYGLEVAWEGEKAGDEKHSVIKYHLSYGLTPDLTMSIVVPHFLEKEEGGSSLTSGPGGLGDISLRGKYRFLRYDAPGVTTGVALNLALKLPSGDERETPPLGSGSVDYAAGLALSREGLRHYFFSDVRYRINTEANGVRKGNVFFFDVAYGIRPWKTDYLKPDLVIVVELNWEQVSRTRVGKVKNPDTGGNHVFVAPGFLLSYRFIMFKGGVQIPILREPNGDGEGSDLRALFSVEMHL